MTTDQLIELQTQVAFQEHTIAELNAVLIKQQQQMDWLRAEVRILTDKLGALEDQIATAPASARDDKPPHY